MKLIKAHNFNKEDQHNNKCWSFLLKLFLVLTLTLSTISINTNRINADTQYPIATTAGKKLLEIWLATQLTLGSASVVGTVDQISQYSGQVFDVIGENYEAVIDFAYRNANNSTQFTLDEQMIDILNETSIELTNPTNGLSYSTGVLGFATLIKTIINGTHGTENNITNSNNIIVNPNLIELNTKTYKLNESNALDIWNSLPRYSGNTSIYYYYPNPEYYIRLNIDSNGEFFTYTKKVESGSTSEYISGNNQLGYEFNLYNNTETRVFSYIDGNIVKTCLAQLYKDIYGNLQVALCGGTVWRHIYGTSNWGTFHSLNVPLNNFATTSTTTNVSVSNPNLTLPYPDEGFKYYLNVYGDLANAINNNAQLNQLQLQQINDNQQEQIQNQNNILDSINNFFSNFWNNLQFTLSDVLSNILGGSNGTIPEESQTTINNYVDDMQNKANAIVIPEDIEEHLGDNYSEVASLANAFSGFWDIIEENGLNILWEAPLIIYIIRLVI